MTSLNLTREEAQQRAALVDSCHYDIDLDLTRGEELFGSTTTVRFTTTTAGSTFIDLRSRRIASATLDGVELDNPHPNDGIELPHMEPGEHTLTVVADCIYSRTGQGLHRFVDPADNEVYMYTQFETADAKRVFCCFDQPDIKATYSMRVTTPTGWKVISNPELSVDRTERGDVHTGSVDYLLSTYLVAFCAGPYHEVRDSWTGTLTHHPETPADQPHEITVPFGIYCRKSLAHALDADTLFTQTKQGFDFYHANFGMAYPFGKYDQVFCPEYNMGAMENAGCVTFRDEYVFTSATARTRYERRCDTVLHELAHMWFGDLVTMRWWGDLWLNESFATWSAAISQAEATEFTTAWVTFAGVDKTWAYGQDQLPSTHPIVADASDIETVEQNFDGITYAKGASVFKQLQAYVGREAFFAGVRQHFANHAFGNATFEDLLGALEKASGRDLSGWAGQWLTTTGINTLSPDFEVAADGTYTRFAVAQTGATPGAGEYRTHRVQVGLYSDNGSTVERTHSVEIDVDGASTEVPELVGVKAADMVLVNDEDLTYAHMGLDEGSLRFAIDNIGRITNPMARALVWTSAWHLVRSGKMRARDFIALVAAGAPTETELFVLESVLAKAQTALAGYADPAWRAAEGNAVLARTLLSGAREHADADARFIFLQALTTIVPTDEVSELMRSILDNAPTIDGITVDAELRWRALTSLIASRAFTPEAARAAIEEEKARDNSSTGRNWAWAAEAAIPDADAKAQILEDILSRGKTMSNLELRHKGQGLTWAGSEPLLTELTARYFEAAPTVWNTFESEVALRTLTEIYPTFDIRQSTVDAAEAFLATDISAGLRRVIMEGNDTVVRCLNNRAVDAAAAADA